MTQEVTEPKLDRAGRMALYRAYQLLIQLANEGTADPETLEGEPGSAANTSAEHRCTTYCTTGTGAQQEGAHNG